MESIFKECGVVMLATNSKTNIYLDKDVLLFEDIPEKITTLYCKGKGFQHLYFTSNDEIKEGDWMWREGEKPTLVTPHFHWDFGVRYKKIIATTDSKLNDKYFPSKHNVPKIPQSLVESYAKNPVDKVMVMYHTSNIVDGGMTSRDGLKQTGEVIMNPYPVPLIYNNEISIKPVEEKMYARDEVDILCRSAMIFGRAVSNIDEVDKWIKENL